MDGLGVDVLRAFGVSGGDFAEAEIAERSRNCLEYANAYFDEFQYWEFMSGSVAAPRFPSDEPRASGAMLSVVTPVFTGLNISPFRSSSAYAVADTSPRAINMYVFNIFIVF